jgi:hypothetical protein
MHEENNAHLPLRRLVWKALQLAVVQLSGMIDMKWNMKLFKKTQKRRKEKVKTAKGRN